MELTKLLIDNAFTLIGTGFVGLFMLLVAGFFFNALRKVDLTSLFITDEPGSRKVSSTKFWTSIAYFVATVAFLAANFVAPVGGSLEIIWAIYMSTVAGHAAFSKWLGTKFGGGVSHTQAPPSTDTEVSVKVKS